jgi:hypothetical protein
MGFQISGLPRETFEPLFGLDDAALRQHRACRVIADRPRAFPCRVSLVDAEVGEPLILVHYEHLPVDSPFRSGHAVYVRVDAEERRLALGEVPLLLRSRTLSVRAFDDHDLMQAAELVDGAEVESVIERLLADPGVAFLHIHYAAPGCFAARVDRA